MAHVAEGVPENVLKRRRPESYSNSWWSREQFPDISGAGIVDLDIQRSIDRINRLNALVDISGEDGEGKELGERNLGYGNFDFPLLAQGCDNSSFQPTILQKASEMMREMDPSRAFFESGIQEALPKTRRSALLPPYEETRELLNGYLQHFNSLFPLFQEETLRRLISRLYTQQEVLDPGSKASGSAVIAMAYKLRLWATANTNIEAAAAWMYFNAAMRFLPEISVIGDNTEGNFRNIQALCLMSIFLQGSMQFNDAPNILGTAIRQANIFDLSQSTSSSGVCPIEVQRTRRVLYVLDKEFSLHTGLPPMTRMGYQASHSLEHGSKDTTNALQNFCSLAEIEEEIYEELYSATAQERPGRDLLNVSFQLERKLRTWANELPFNLRHNDGFSSESSDAILLSLMFNNCLITIHRLPAIHCPNTGLYSCHAGSNSEISNHIELAKITRTKAAISCIRSAQQSEAGGLWPFWLILPPTIASLILLLTTIVYDPETSISKEIMDSIDSGVRLIQLVNDRSHGEFSQTLRIAAGTADVARRLQQKGQDDIAARKLAQIALEAAVMELRRGMRPRNRNRPLRKPNTSESPIDRVSAQEDQLYESASIELTTEGFSGAPVGSVQLDPWESLSWVGELDYSAPAWESGATFKSPEHVNWEDFIPSNSKIM